MTRLTPQASAQRLHVEGVFLSPAHPGVRSWLANIAKEIASRYAVDGIHLDYIRQPGVAIGYDPTSRAQFALVAGADPLTFDRLPTAERARMDSAWAELPAGAGDRHRARGARLGERGAPRAAAVGGRAGRHGRGFGATTRRGARGCATGCSTAPSRCATHRPCRPSWPSSPPCRRRWARSGSCPASPSTTRRPPPRRRRSRERARWDFPAVALYSYDSLWERERPVEPAARVPERPAHTGGPDLELRTDRRRRHRRPRGPAQHRHHRPRRPRQDHARGRDALAERRLPREPGGRRARHGLERPRAREGHHHPRQEHRRPVRQHTRSTSSTRPGTPTSAARSSARSRWWTACCCWWTRARARCRRRASCSRRRSSWGCSRSS